MVYAIFLEKTLYSIIYVKCTLLNITHFLTEVQEYSFKEKVALAKKILKYQGNEEAAPVKKYCL